MIKHLQESPTYYGENPVVAKIPSNTKGRDFVCGDLHGSFPSVEEFLDEVRFNTSKDRLLCVGDLTDRGPDSLRCLKLLQEPWFHCILGNHDENTIEALSEHLSRNQKELTAGEPWIFLAKNGGQWLLKEAANPQNSKILAAALENLRQLPRILIVGEGKSRFQLVHAALVKRDTPEIKLLSDERIDKALTGEKPLKQVALLNQARQLARLAHENLLENPDLNERFKKAEGLSLTHCGHSSFPVAAQILSHFHLDTGAGKPDREGKIRWLSFTEPNEPNSKVLRFRAGNPRLKIKTKDAVKEAVKTTKANISQGIEME